MLGGRGVGSSGSSTTAIVFSSLPDRPYTPLVLRKLMLIAVLVGLIPAVAADAHDTPGFDFEGAGAGHRVGMGQWGAYGQALADPAKLGEDIAAYYFPGSEPASLGDLSLPNGLLQTLDNPIWVNLGRQVTLLEFVAVGGPLDLCLSNDGEGACPKPEQPQEGERWQLRRIARNECGFFHEGELQGTAGVCRAAISWPEADGVRLRHGEGRNKICSVRASEECEYRHGELKIRDDPVEVGFHVVLAVGLEDYVKGTAEIPDDWEAPGVNEAQAVAARTYAAFNFFQSETGPRPADPDDDPGISAARKDRCWCHLYDSWRDINYIGWAKESRSRSQPWLEGVETTRDRVLTYFGDEWEKFTKAGIVQAFFSASSGGFTRSNIYGFYTGRNSKAPTSRMWPYLAPVADPWDLDPAVGNPNASWEERVSASAIARWLRWEEVTEAILVTRESVSSPAEVMFRGVRDGEPASVTVAGVGLRTGLGLRSSNITAIDGVAPPPGDDSENPTPGNGNDGKNPEEPAESDSFDDDGGVHEPSINRLAAAGVLEGTECGERRICPDEPLLRWVMAVWITRALDQAPESSDARTRFADVDPDAWWASYVERLADLGVTEGCKTDPLRYCPDKAVTRAQMATFLVRAFNLDAAPPAGFADTGGDAHEANIDALAAVGVPTGCETDPLRYCPDKAVTRAQMATFLVRALDLMSESTTGT